MIVTNVVISYRCVKCNIPYNFKFALKTVASPTEVAKHIPNIKQCVVCKQDMHIKHAILKVINANSEYGDDVVGSWRCPFHTSFVYYPRMMREATEGTLSIATTGQILYHRYLKIAAVKYPWTCPLCAELLKYKIEKYSCME